MLGEGAAALDELGLRIEAARAMVDLGRAMARVGEDPRAVFERARECWSSATRAFLFEVEDGVAGLDT